MKKARIFYGLFIKLLLVVFLLSCDAKIVQAQLWGNNGSTNGAYGFSSSFGTGGGSCQKTDCKNSTCQLTLDSQGHLAEKCPSGKRYDVDPNCVMNQNAQAGSCMDTMPVASINRVAETNCYRANGAGGNPKPRNHLGTDYASVEGTIITAAADGTVVWAKPMGGAGRTIVIEHTKKCACSAGNANAGCDDKYITVYMHMKEYLVGGGSVKKGDPIGRVGGSNYVTARGELCDAGQGTSTCHPYGPHLHFEIHSGAWNKGYSTLKSSIINPLCDDIQSFCGGCSYNVQEECTGKTNTDQWTTLSDAAQQEKKVNNPPPGISSAVPGDGGDGISPEDKEKCDYQNFLLASDECIFCPLFKTLFNAASALALRTYNALKDSIANVVIVAFAIWIAWFVLKQISALEVKKPSKMIQELLVQTFRVLIVLLILKVSYAQVLRLTISPIFDTASNYIQSLMGKDSTCSPSASYLQGLKGFEKELDDSASGAMPLSMGRDILCSMKAMQDGVWRLIAFGRECRCVGWHIKSFIFHLIPHLSYVFTGDFLIAAGLILLLAFPWCLIDCILNMAVAIALLPAAIGAWAFKITSKYLNTIWNFFMNAVFQFVFMSIILYIIITVVEGFLKEVETYATDYEAIIDPIHGLAFWSVNGLKLVMVCLLGWVFLDNAKELAGNFAGAPNLGIGRSTGTFFAQAGERLALGSKDKDGKRHGGALGIVKGGVEMGKMAGQHFIGTPLKRKVGQLRSDWVKKNGTATTDENGNTVYEMNRSLFGKRNILGQKVTRRVVQNADGTMTYSQEKETLGTQIHNWTRESLNTARVNLIQKHDDRYRELFADPNQNIRRLDDGTQQLLNSKGKVIASMKINSDRTVSISNKRGITVYDEHGYLLSAQKSYRNPLLLGEKQTLSINNVDGKFQAKRSTSSLRTEALGIDAKLTGDSRLEDIVQTYGVKRERDLSSRVGKTQSVTKDHLVAIRDIKNDKGEVIQQDIAFKPSVTKYLIDTHGRLNTQMIAQIQQGTTVGQDKINLAIANEILKDRKIKLENKFFERKVRFENGKLILTQRNLDGSVTNLTTETRGDQMLITSRTVDQKGNITHIVDNGVMSRVVSKKANGEAIASYSFNSHVRAFSSQSNLINKHGEFANIIDENEAMWGFEEYDRQLHAKQVDTGEKQSFDISHIHQIGEPQGSQNITNNNGSSPTTPVS